MPEARAAEQTRPSNLSVTTAAIMKCELEFVWSCFLLFSPVGPATLEFPVKPPGNFADGMRTSVVSPLFVMSQPNSENV